MGVVRGGVGAGGVSLFSELDSAADRVSSGHGVLIWPRGILFLALGSVVAVKGTHEPLLAPKKMGHAEFLGAGCAALVGVFGYFCYR